MINPSTVLHKRTTVPNRTPSSLSAGEIAMNMADGTLFIPNAEGGVFTFLDQTQHSFTLQSSLSGSVPQYGGNTITEVFGNVLGGYNNNITGAGSTTVNGENNDIEGDFSFIGTGLNNKIGSTGDYSAILGGQYNLINHQNSFTLGSNLSSHADNFTYVNNISGKFWGDGSELRDTRDTGVRSLTSTWDSTYSTVQSNSGVNWNYQGTDLKDLSGNWQSTYTTVQNTSASWSSVYSNVQSNSANSVSVYSTVQSASASWNSVYSNVQSNSATYVTLSGTQTLTNKTVVDWMTLVRGYKTTPTLNATIGTGEVWNYVYTSSPSDKTYYRFIATDGSEDAFYASFNGTAVSNLIARKGITI